MRAPREETMSGLFTKDIAVLDVGSRLISAIVGVKKAQSVFGIKAVQDKEYAGFENGEWLDEADTSSAAVSVLRDAMLASESRTKRVFIGVPAEFTAAITKEVSVTLDRERRVVDADVDYLIKKGEAFDDDSYVLINSAPVSFTIDTSDKIYSDARGLTAGELKGLISYILCEKSFVKKFDAVVSSLGFKEIKYVSSAWAEGIAMFEKEERDNVYALADIGFISSSVLIGSGEGILDLKSFSLGGGHISADMCEYLDVDFELAEKARDLVDLNLGYAEDAILVADQDTSIFGSEACEIVRAKLDTFAEIIGGIVEKSGLPSYAPVYLTGEGIAAIRGAKKYLGAQLGRTVEIIAPKLPGYAKPCNASKISLLIVAESLAKFNLAESLKKIFNGGNL